MKILYLNCLLSFWALMYDALCPFFFKWRITRQKNKVYFLSLRWPNALLYIFSYPIPYMYDMALSSLISSMICCTYVVFYTFIFLHMRFGGVLGLVMSMIKIIISLQIPSSQVLRWVCSLMCGPSKHLVCAFLPCSRSKWLNWAAFLCTSCWKQQWENKVETNGVSCRSVARLFLWWWAGYFCSEKLI